MSCVCVWGGPADLCARGHRVQVHVRAPLLLTGTLNQWRTALAHRQAETMASGSRTRRVLADAFGRWRRGLALRVHARRFRTTTLARHAWAAWCGFFLVVARGWHGSGSLTRGIRPHRIGPRGVTGRQGRRAAPAAAAAAARTSAASAHGVDARGPDSVRHALPGQLTPSRDSPRRLAEDPRAWPARENSDGAGR